jgi:hypothetical protein
MIAGVVAAGGAIGYVRAVRPWHLRWGATAEEATRRLPGDELVADPELDTTRATTIDAPIDEVWPWLAQTGQTRGGFYSYTWPENLVGCRMHNADRIVPEWQGTDAGDKVWLHPRVALPVREVVPGRAIVLGDTWTFVLEPIGEQTTRFLVRGRGHFRQPDLKLPALNFVYWRLIFEPAHFIMERKMMLGIKERAERAHRAPPVRSEPMAPAASAASTSAG